MFLSYECTELINELENDIAEFGGDKVVAVWCKNISGNIFYTNYDFIDEEEPISELELETGEHLETMTMSALLILLEQQNRII